MNDGVNKTAILLFWGLSILPIALMCFVWLMSPFGFGFQDWPDGVLGFCLHVIYFISYFLALPLMVLAMLACPILALLNRQKLAIQIPFSTFAFFVLTAGTVLIFVH